MKEFICYCFAYTVDDIKSDYEKNGKSLILERIIEEKKVMVVTVQPKIQKGNDALEMFAG